MTTSAPSVGCVDNTHLWIEENVLLMEANIDDMTAELIAHLLDLLMAGGARDAWSAPIGMKKSRPGVTVSVLCMIDQRDQLLRVIFEQSTTIGVRFQTMGRVALRRKLVTLSTPYGEIGAKVSYLGDRAVTVKAEYEDCRGAAERAGVSVRRVQEAASAAAQGYYDATEEG
jgi:uncharacterized protein (DUF111 family)